MKEEETTRAIVEEQIKQGNIEEVKDVSGLIKKTYLVNFNDKKGIVVCWMNYQGEGEKFKIESSIIELVNKETELPVPEIIVEDFSHDNLPPYYIMEKIDGYNPDRRFKYMPERVKKYLLQKSGEMLARLHENTGFDSVGNFTYSDGLELEEKDRWSDALYDSMGHHMRKLDETFFKDMKEETERTFEEYRDMIDIDFEPVLVHEDFRPGNLIVKENKINGIIDWGRSLSGHSEYDLFKAERDFIDLKFWTPKVREKYRDHLINGYRKIRDLKDGWKKRREFYRFVHLAQDMIVFGKNHERWFDDEKIIEERTESIRENVEEQIEKIESLE